MTFKFFPRPGQPCFVNFLLQEFRSPRDKNRDNHGLPQTGDGVHSPGNAITVTTQPSIKKSKSVSFWNTAACFVWIIVLLVLIARPLVAWHRGTSFDTYNLAGSHWLRGENLYSQWMGFVYSPVVAAFFAPFALVSAPLANIIWRLLNAAVLLGGFHSISPLFAAIKSPERGLGYLLLAPLALGNIDISQANPLVAGLIMLAIAAVYRQQWNWAALCLSIAIFFKIYPLAVGLLICVIAPRRFAWRLFCALLLLALVPFLFQHWPYVSHQYDLWFSTRMADNRKNWPVEKLPLDLWFLIHWVLHLPIPQKLFSVIQLASVLAIALFCAFGTWKKWSPERVLIGLFCLSAVWMTVCGPATESYTYLLLAAPTILVFLQSLHSRQPLWMRIGIWASIAMQYLAVARASFIPHFKPSWILAALPVSALLFLSYCLAWLLSDIPWTEQRGSRLSTSEGHLRFRILE